MKNDEIKIIFFGTPTFASQTLKSLIGNKYSIVGVVTKKAKPQGRKKEILISPVQIIAKEHSVPVIDSDNSDIIFDKIKEFDPHLGILFAYGKIIPQKIIDIFPLGILNIHPSLLPKYRGPSPVQSAILNGEKETGVTVMLLDNAMDHGDIITSQKTIIGDDELSYELHDRLAKMGTDLLIKVLPDYINKKITPRPQNHSEATFCESLSRHLGVVNWQTTPDIIYNQFRALFPWPGIFTYWRQKRLKLTKIRPNQGQFEGQIGQVSGTKAGFPAVFCSNGKIVIEKVQLEGKSEMSAKDFVKGYPDFIGSVLGDN